MPDIPRKPLVLVGYWLGPHAPGLPDPRDFVDPSWGAWERWRVQRYLEAGMVARVYRGQSTCRFCNEPVGHRELTDRTYIWPEGLAHYVAEHDVRVPAEFVDHAIRTVQDLERCVVDSTWWAGLEGPGPARRTVVVASVGDGSPAPVLVESAAGMLRGVWVGDPPDVGDVVDVELDIPGTISWGDVVVGAEPAARRADGRGRLSGLVKAVEPDGVVILRSGVGLTLLVMTGDAPDGIVGAMVSVPVDEIRFFPTGV